MKSVLNFQIIIIFYFMICFQLLFNKVNPKIYFTYPYGITLPNDNIFIVHKLGIDIIDPLFTKIIKKVLIFSEQEKINTLEEFSKLEIKYSYGYIIVLIKDKIYIFNINGDLLASSTDKITNDQFINYYTLVPLTMQNSYLFFIVGFFDKNNYLNIILYKFKTKYKYYAIIKVKTKIETKFTSYYDDTYNYKNKGLACEFMIYSDYSSYFLLTCFFTVQSYTQFLTVGYYIINEDDIIKYSLYNPLFEANNVQFIKLAITSNKKLGFICFYKKFDDHVYCFNFDISNQEIYKDFRYKKLCRDKVYGLKVNYISKTDKISFSCIDYDGSIQADFFDSKLYSEYSTSIKQFSSCENIYGHSILYLNNEKKYFILSDVKCDDTEYLLQELESSKLEDISNINEYKEEEKEKEEEEEENEKEKEIQETETINCELEKCESCDEFSAQIDLCITCNKKLNYYPKKSQPSKKISFYNNYIDCYNNKTKPTNFYFNKDKEYFEPCFKNCATCEYGGDYSENNCTSCEKTLIFSPDIVNTTNCVKKCDFFYYYKKFSGYSCTQESICPENYNLLVKDKGKCTDDCKNENIYNYYYNGECLKECPHNTKDINNDFICKDFDLKKCLLKNKYLYYFNENKTEDLVQNYILEYIKDFNYTNSHVTLYENIIYSITIYKNGECISLLNLTIPEIDFGECYKKLQKNYEIEENLVVAIVTKKEKNKKTSTTIFYAMYDPKEGKQLDGTKICNNEVIIMNSSLVNKLEAKNVNMSSILFFTGQNIDIFNRTSVFYTDICYHFNMPIKKDVSLKDRILIYFPNISLCEDNCKIIGVNLAALKSICQCKYNFKNKNNLEDSLIYQTGVGELTNILSHTNIEIIKCYKDILMFKNFISNIGGFIILFFITIQIIFTIIYYKKGLYSLRKYIFDVTNKYISYLYLHKNDRINTIVFAPYNININLKKSVPPKRKSYSNKQINEFDIFQNTQNLKRKKRKGKTKISKKYNLDDNSLKLGNSNEINVNSNNILMSNEQIFSNDKIKNLNNDNNNTKLQFSQKSLISSKSTNKEKKIELKDIQSNLIINLKESISINIEEFLNTDPDDMDYDDARKRDKRKFKDYFLDKLKNNQIFLNTFYSDEPLRPRAIKILLLILNIDLYFFINGLFFNEEYISDVFHSNDDKSFSDFLFRFTENCFYTTFAGVFVNYLIDCFFVEEKKIKGILKREKDNTFFLNYEITQLIKNIQKRYKYFIVVSFVITSFTWYYVSCFNNIYPYTKGEWIKTSIMIIIIMQIFSILVSLLESIIRYFSFKCKSEKLYNIIKWFS